jgi:signal transduction histidine kinase
MLASGAGYGLMKSQLAARQDARVTEIFAAIEQTSLEGDESDLVEAVEARIQASRDRATAYLLRDQTGKVLASNMGDISLPGGWSTIASSRIGGTADYPYRIFSGAAGPYSLTVGLTNADLEDLQEIVLGAFGWAGLFALLAAIGVGTVLALRVQSRMAEAEAAAARVALGDLSARLPVSDRRDDLDRISQAVNASLERLAGLVEAMRQVSADMAHELRTPLNRLRIHLMEAQRKMASGAVADDDMAAALAQSEAIDKTFAALLRIAQIEAGARREKFACMDLDALIGDVAAIYADVAEDAGQTLVLDRGGPVWVVGDKELLTQAFANLIENSIRHCPPSTAITCTLRANGEQVVACVCDTGPGIAESERPLVLRRLYRADKSRTAEGTGLGLALVKAVADLHGAELALADAAPGLRVELRFARVEATGGSHA